MFKKVLLVITVFIWGLVLLNCGGKKEGIIGKWEIVSATGSMAELNKGMTFEFDTKGSMIMKKGFANEAKYTLAGEELTYTVGSVTMKATIKIIGDKMTMTIQNSDQVFELVRK